MARVKVLVVAEGASEIGDLDALAGGGGRRGARRREGFIPPLLRKLLAGIPLEIEAQKVASIGRLDRKPRIPGHGDRAAKALSLAASRGFQLLVFVKDVDKASSTKNTAAQRRDQVRTMADDIDRGFAAVSDAAHVHRVKATPCRMIEAWALGDSKAIHAVRDKTINNSVPQKPEELWGRE